MTADLDFIPNGELSGNGHHAEPPARRGRRPRTAAGSAPAPGLALSVESAARLAAELDTVADGLERDDADRLTRDRVTFLRGVADAARSLHAS